MYAVALTWEHDKKLWSISVMTQMDGWLLDPEST